MRLNLAEHMQRRIFWMGYYSTDIVNLLKKSLWPGMVIIDIGANIGEITMVAARRVGPEGKVIAFEPVSVIAERLSEHVITNNLTQVIVKKEALGTETGRMPIYPSCGQYVADENQGLASLYGEKSQQQPIEYVEVNTLDKVAELHDFSRIDLIKIDVEGGELACLQGAMNVLQKFRPMLIVEIQEFSAHQAGWEVNELFDYLRGFGYEFFSIGKKGRLSPLNLNALADFQNVFCKAQGA
ncbi:FkbM family methyltransferase [Halopseudomonas yangmingensis]|uniref:Methyltransferase, FkbM family n=1 Tax=Halopseudomonas yangmingensis TaxID=1720063 RepID=A0A1I4NYE2_9GAMM|nr:FkbM family methyltransferase [Halopseudomonas yangmingensis]SFM20542.1 methyltransferase, FkbM family [Halopseudomonas yangmingensis]